MKCIKANVVIKKRCSTVNFKGIHDSFKKVFLSKKGRYNWLGVKNYNVSNL